MVKDAEQDEEGLLFPLPQNPATKVTIYILLTVLRKHLLDLPDKVRRQYSAPHLQNATTPPSMQSPFFSRNERGGASMEARELQ